MVNSFGERLRELRKERGLSQKELADILKIGRSAIGLYETNARKPDPETITLFADYFNVSTDWLLGRGGFVGNSILGERLKQAREKKGWSEVYVANLLGITSQALSNYERGERDPDTPLLKKLAILYNVSTDSLLGLKSINIKDERLPGGEIIIKVKPDWEKKGLNTKENIEKIIEQALAYNEILNEMKSKKE